VSRLNLNCSTRQKNRSEFGVKRRNVPFDTAKRRGTPKTPNSRANRIELEQHEKKEKRGEEQNSKQPTRLVGIVVIGKWFDWTSDTTVGIGLTSFISTSQMGLDFAPMLSTN